MIDPPWESGEVPTVSLTGLRELTIPAADGRAFVLVAGWFAPYHVPDSSRLGIRDRTVLTWFKPKPSGWFDYFRPRTERTLFAEKGTLALQHRTDDWF